MLQFSSLLLTLLKRHRTEGCQNDITPGLLPEITGCPLSTTARSVALAFSRLGPRQPLHIYILLVFRQENKYRFQKCFYVQYKAPELITEFSF